MAQGEFTKEETKETEEAVVEIFKALTKRKQGEFLGHLNDVLLFLDAAGRSAPTESAIEWEAKKKAAKS